MVMLEERDLIPWLVKLHERSAESAFLMVILLLRAFMDVFRSVMLEERDMTAWLVKLLETFAEPIFRTVMLLLRFFREAFRIVKLMDSPSTESYSTICSASIFP
jgi:hypothetical protein